MDEKKNFLDDMNSLILFSENVFDEYGIILEQLTKKYSFGDHFLIIGNGLNYYIAKEISLKIRETTGINTSYDDVGQLNHGGINSVNNKSICILLEYDEKILKKIVERGGKIIRVGEDNNCNIKYKSINRYIESIQKIILLQYFVHKLATSLNINTNEKLW